jgi:hypothetical protein
MIIEKFTDQFVLTTLYTLMRYNFTEEEIFLFTEADVPVGKRTKALTKVGHMCVKKGMTDEEAMAMLINADWRWGKYVYRYNKIMYLQNIIDYCRKRAKICNGTFNQSGHCDSCHAVNYGRRGLKHT